MRKSFLVLLCLTGLSLLIYSRTVNYPFVYDDNHVIINNPSIRSLPDLPALFISSHNEPGEKASSYRPLLYSTYALNYAISGLATWSYRAFDILLHTLCSLLVYLIAASVIRERGGIYTWPAAAASIVFCVHPVQTESVIYVSARSALLVCTLFLASVYCYLNARTCGRSTGPGGGKGDWIWMALSLIALALALLTKETAAALLPFFFTLELYFKKKKGIAFSFFFISAAAAITAVYSALRLYFMFGGNVQKEYNIIQYYIIHWIGWISYFPTYIRLLLFPLGQSIYYPFPGESIYYLNEIQIPRLLIGSAVIIFLILLLVWQFRRKDYLIAGFLLLAALSFLPEFIFAILDLVVEYRLYLPLAALCISGAAAIAKVSSRRVLTMAKYGIAASAAIFSILSFIRAGVWASDKSIWEDAAIKYPRLELPHLGLGYYYNDIKEYQKALGELEIARSLNPLDVKVYQNLGITYSGLGLFPQAEGAFLKALSLDNYYALYRDLETLYILEGKDEKARQNYGAMAEKFPGQNVSRDLAEVASGLGRADLASVFMREPVK